MTDAGTYRKERGPSTSRVSTRYVASCENATNGFGSPPIGSRNSSLVASLTSASTLPSPTTRTISSRRHFLSYLSSVLRQAAAGSSAKIRSEPNFHGNFLACLNAGPAVSFLAMQAMKTMLWERFPFVGISLSASQNFSPHVTLFCCFYVEKWVAAGRRLQRCLPSACMSKHEQHFAQTWQRGVRMAG